MDMLTFGDDGRLESVDPAQRIGHAGCCRCFERLERNAHPASGGRNLIDTHDVQERTAKDGLMERKIEGSCGALGTIDSHHDAVLAALV
jgi:hypothetical protein